MKAPATLDNEAAANVKISASLPAFGNAAFSFFFLFGESVFSFPSLAGFSSLPGFCSFLPFSFDSSFEFSFLPFSFDSSFESSFLPFSFESSFLPSSLVPFPAPMLA